MILSQRNQEVKPSNEVLMKSHVKGYTNVQNAESRCSTPGTMQHCELATLQLERARSPFRWASPSVGSLFWHEMKSLTWIHAASPPYRWHQEDRLHGPPSGKRCIEVPEEGPWETWCSQGRGVEAGQTPGRRSLAASVAGAPGGALLLGPGSPSPADQPSSSAAAAGGWSHGASVAGCKETQGDWDFFWPVPFSASMILILHYGTIWILIFQSMIKH